MPHLVHIALVFCDDDKALAFDVGKLGFTLIEDTSVPEQNKRWVTIRPPGAPAGAATILLPSAAFPTMLRIAGTLGGSARAGTPEQARFVGDQAGGRVFLFLATDDFARDHAAFTAAGVEWVRSPVDQPYGRVAVFADLYGNRWDLVKYAPACPDASPSPR